MASSTLWKGNTAVELVLVRNGLVALILTPNSLRPFLALLMVTILLMALICVHWKIACPYAIMNEHGHWRKGFVIPEKRYFDRLSSFWAIKVYEDGDLLLAMERNTPIVVHYSRSLKTMQEIDLTEPRGHVCSIACCMFCGVAIAYTPSFLRLKTFARHGERMLVLILCRFRLFVFISCV